MKTELIFILDASGSMYPFKDDTITNYNKLISEQRELSNDCTVSTVIFQGTFDFDIDCVSYRDHIDNVKMLDSNSYCPTGSTPLYDAVCITMDKIGESLAATPEKDRPDNVMVVIITDGVENSSVRFTSKDVKNRIEHQRTKYSWDFNFIGTNIEVEEVAQNIGITIDSAFAYDNSTEGISAVYTSLSKSINDFTTTGAYSKIELSNSISNI